MLKTCVDKTALVVLPRIVWAYLWTISVTCTIKVYGSEYPDGLRKKDIGFIYAFWHNRQIILPIIRPDEPIHCLISSSRDGEYISRVAALFGKASIRGSTTRGGFEAMKQMMRVLTSKGVVAITPDGPLGPALEVKPGVVQMSQAVGCPIVPIAFDASKKKVFASWDSFNLPYPFSKVSIVFGEPLTVPPSESIEAACLRLQHALNEVTEAATQRLLNS